MNSYTVKNETCQSCEYQENLGILREIHFFSELSLEALKVLAYLCTRETFKKGDALFSQSDDDGQAFYILSGTACLVHKDESGEMVIRNYESGEFVGGLTLLGSMRRVFSLQALSDMNCLVLTREKFIKVIEQFPDCLPKIFKAVVETVRAWEERLFIDHREVCEGCMKKAGVSLV